MEQTGIPCSPEGSEFIPQQLTPTTVPNNNNNNNCGGSTNGTSTSKIIKVVYARLPWEKTRECFLILKEHHELMSIQFLLLEGFPLGNDLCINVLQNLIPLTNLKILALQGFTCTKFFGSFFLYFAKMSKLESLDLQFILDFQMDAMSNEQIPFLLPCLKNVTLSYTNNSEEVIYLPRTLLLSSPNIESLTLSSYSNNVIESSTLLYSMKKLNDLRIDGIIIVYDDLRMIYLVDKLPKFTYCHPRFEPRWFGSEKSLRTDHPLRKTNLYVQSLFLECFPVYHYVYPSISSKALD